MNLAAQKNRLLFWLTIILAVGFLGISLLSYYVSRDSIRKGIVTQSLPLAGDTVYSEIQSDILRPIYLSAQMAENTFLRDWVLGGEQDEMKIRNYLGTIQKRFQANTAFFISDRSKNYYHPKGIIEVINRSDARDNWYFDFRQKNIEYELNADPDYANRNRMTIFINYRLQDQQGRFLGITGIGVTFDTLTALVRRIEQRFADRVYFANATGRISFADSRHSELKGDIKNLFGISSIARQILAKKTPQQLTYSNKDAVVQVNSRFISELNWYLIVEQNETLAFAPSVRILLINLLLGALATGLVLGCTIFVINQYQKRLERLAMIDSLTEAKTRSVGEGLLEQAQKEALREKKPLSVLLFDIDNFKQINDTYGHATGDMVLREVVQLTQALLRTTDSLVRWGGEEFLIILKNCALENAESIAEQIKSQVAAHPFLVDGASIRVTISVGVAHLEPQQSIQQLVRCADDAQYAAKRNGKNRVAVATVRQTRAL